MNTERELETVQCQWGGGWGGSGWGGRQSSGQFIYCSVMVLLYCSHIYWEWMCSGRGGGEGRGGVGG